MSREYGGPGLGLSLCQQLVTHLGGKLSVKSQIGQGSTFCATFPLPSASSVQMPKLLQEAINADAGSQCTVQDSNNNSDLAGVTILLAEDVITNQLLVKEILEENNATVITANNGQEALTTAQSGVAIDLILMDIQMPKLDGFDTTVAIHALPNHSNTPIIAMTASVTPEDISRCIKAGMQAHIAKPIEAQALLDTILTTLRH